MRRDPSEVLQIVAKYYGFPISALKGPRRTGRIVEARQMAMLLGCSYAERITDVGRAIGRDRNTVLHGHKQASIRIERDIRAKRDFEFLKEQIEDPAHRLADQFPAEQQAAVLALVAEGAAKGAAVMAEHVSSNLLKLIGDLK
tara:strand:+ start:6948 stop:7376 length:429 start_codon:yes stop_codon:yes gene_type:complete